MKFPPKQIRTYMFALITVTLLILCACSCGDDGSKPKTNEVGVVYGVPTILRMFPHDTDAFTQGLLYADSFLYESTGLPKNQSRLRKIDPYGSDSTTAGEVLKSITAPGFMTFTEGLALKDNKLVQLTWGQEIAFIYTYPGMVLIDTLYYEGQGWGLTNDATRFIMSNGTDTLYFRDNEFNITGKVNVTLEGNPLYQLNELEYVQGKVWANVLNNKSIYQINPLNGQVTKVIDCTELDALVAPQLQGSVLNGIAYNSDEGTYFITGKLWRYIFEVTIP